MLVADEGVGGGGVAKVQFLPLFVKRQENG